MKSGMRGSILSSWILFLTLAMPYSFSAYSSYESLEYTNDEVVFLGDIVTIDAGWCWPSKKPMQSLAKKRLEIYKSGKWISVGKVIFPKSDICQKKTPYLQQFQWEVDELGIIDPDQVSGKLRMRNSSVKPTIYSKITVFESELAYRAKLKAVADAAAAKADADADAAADTGRRINCIVRGGEWNFAGKYCLNG